MSPATQRQVDTLRIILSIVMAKHRLRQQNLASCDRVLFGFNQAMGIDAWMLDIYWRSGRNEQLVAEKHTVELQVTDYIGRPTKYFVTYSGQDAITDKAFDYCYKYGAKLFVMYNQRSALYGQYWHDHGERVMQQLARGENNGPESV